MNNRLSDAKIEQVNQYNLSQIKNMFDDIINDTDFNKRRKQQLGVDARRRLIPANTYKPFGRDATGVPVYARPDSKGYTGDYETNMKSHKDFVSMITDTKSGYMSGFELNSENKNALDKLNEFVKINSFDAKHVDLVSSTCAYAVKALRLYSNPIKGVTIADLEPWNYAPFYNKEGSLVGVMQWVETSKEIRDQGEIGQYMVSYVNENEDMYFYTSKTGDELIPNSHDYPARVLSSGLELQEGRVPHTFKGVPVVEFFNNENKIGDVEKTLDSQDAYDELVSKASTAYGAFADVLLVDKTKPEEWHAEQTPEDFKEMMRVLKDSGKLTGDWEWLTKNYEGYQNLILHLNLLNSNIFEGSNSFDPNQKSDTGSSPTKYQVQQKYKPLVDSSTKTEMQFRKSYLELFRLVLTEGVATKDNKDYLDVNILFKKTIPEDQVATLKLLKEAGVTVPMELAYTAAGYKWDEVKLMLEEDRERIMSELDNEDGFNEEGLPRPTEGAIVDQAGAGVQMNGAQVTAAKGIVTDVAAGTLKKEAGINMLKTFFNLTSEQANALFAGIIEGSIKEDA